MNKLGKKLFLSISLTVILIFTISLLLINYLLPKYNIYKTRENLNEFTVQIQNTPVNELEEVIRTIESENNVTVAYTSINQSEDNMNEALRMQLTKKKVVLNKLWITKDEVMKVKAEGQSNKLYDQEKLKASFFAKYIAKDNTIILMGTSIAHSNEVIKTLNTFYL
ncbi:sensor histidine kinase, partial [Bacillus tropicus]|nr:sensor histidine kinase [Bacillus tropicus]